MDSQQLRCFIAVADRLSFSRAADSLYLSQPAVTYRITQLEQSLGVALFDRSGKRIALTPAGAELRSRAEDLFSYMNEVVHHVQNTHRATSGALSISHFFPESDPHFHRAMVEFSRLQPDIQAEVSLPAYFEIIDAVCSGAVDAAIVPENYLAERSRTNLSLVRLFQTRESCVMSSEHPLAAKQHVTLADIEGSVYIAPPQEQVFSVMSPSIRHICSHPEKFPVFPVSELAEAFLQTAMGRGVMILPGSAQCLPYRLIQRPLTDGALMDISLLFLRGNSSNQLQTFTSFLTEFYQHS